MTKKIFLLFTCLYLALPAMLMAQVNDPEKQYTAFDMRHNGKIYVVVSVNTDNFHRYYFIFNPSRQENNKAGKRKQIRISIRSSKEPMAALRRKDYYILKLLRKAGPE